ncbi:protein kinase [Micromonospora sp. NPDC005553]|uniref:protein kinase domain-containing protein n=1 Tax=unclassified Micromonospora TaxID=2617518 RepID=UPI00339DF480
MRGIADYTFIRPLGSGNHGTFYLANRPARLPIPADLVAVKVLHAESEETAFRRATRELAAFAAVRSPYLVDLYDAGQHDGFFYYSTEYLPDGSLAQPAVPVDRSTALRALADAARALSALHAAGIAHRDIKPGNVLLRDGGGRLADLGLSQIFTEGATITGMGSADSVEYVDPAVLLGDPAGPDGDVWSLGATVHRVLAGSGVHGELPPGNALLALRAVLARPPRVDPDLPDALRGLVADCLAPAGDRPTAAQVAARLDGIAAENEA